MTTDLDEDPQAISSVDKRNYSKAAFAESLCSRCVSALSFAGESQSDEVFLLQTGVAADFVTSSGGSEENEAGAMIAMSARVLVSS